MQEVKIEQTAPLTRSQKRKQRTAAKQQNNSLRIKRIHPLTNTQSDLFNAYQEYDILSLHGYPGTGKTFLALYLALQELENNDSYNHIKIVRSNVAVRELGFLPGSAKDKMAAFESPYIALCGELYDRADAYEILKNKKSIEFTPTSHMRGVTFQDCIVIIDECQNMSFQELNTLLTRVGENCKLILCGDIYQDDLTSDRYKEVSGYRDVLKILEMVDMCKSINFNIEDIVRSGFVKQYILAKIKFERGERTPTVRFDRLARSVANSSVDGGGIAPY